MIDQLQDYIARFGHGSAKLARQAQSKEKVLGKMVANGLTEKVTRDKVRTSLVLILLFTTYRISDSTKSEFGHGMCTSGREVSFLWWINLLTKH